ncbi:MAG: transglycosylase [Nitrospirae bacterium]|nr:transglycosylase [Nitrospirota bacterium]
MINSKKLFFIMLAILSFVTCARLPVTRPEMALKPLSWWRAVSPQDDLAFKDISAAARQSLEYYRKLPPETVFSIGPAKATALDMTVTLQNFLLIVENASLSDEQKVKQIKKEFDFYQSVGSDGWGKVLVTGYYEPMLSCRVNADDVYKYPVYKRPDDIVEIDLSLFGNDFPRNKLSARIEGRKVLPYYSREEIDQKQALSGRNLEILWCRDLVDIYFLQIQGSGKADLGNGDIVSILYDGQNGRQYKSLGRQLIDKGAITKENMSMPAIREYLRAHPEEIVPLLNQNLSYVFFRMDMGPSLGNIGVPLTPGRSIATDSKLLPKGALALIKTQKPIIENGAIKEWVPFTRFVLNQDTGGAIKGPGRVDLFWGQGTEAELSAGYMQQEGKLYFLIRKK